ncbi:MAG: tetratricopeptide repeat protein [Desulfovibrio sp.]|nr:MAG: tetratricopeptide repeat protein [Desulfovibrio sp.]
MCVLLLLVVQGCAAVHYMDDQVTGNWYLREDLHEEGACEFEARVAEHPDSSVTQYYLGRFLLALDRPEQAKDHLREAVRLNPDSAQYRYWLGVAHWALDDSENERKAYEQALELDPDYISARVYLGHNLMDSGDTRGALTQYNLVLSQAPGQPDALYNKAAALTILGEDYQAVQAWKTYLGYYPEGSMAREAALNLNRSGNFSYRTQVIGVRQMVLEWITFETGTAVLSEQALPNLDAVGSVMASNQRFQLTINSFKEGNQDLAQARAQSVRNYILENHAEVSPDRILIEAHGRAERISVGNKTFALGESIVFHTTQ